MSLVTLVSSSVKLHFVFRHGNLAINQEHYYYSLMGLTLIHYTNLILPSFLLGKFGMVYKAEMLKRDGKSTTVAIKKINSFMPDFLQDITTMLVIAHPNIVRLHGLVNEGK